MEEKFMQWVIAGVDYFVSWLREMPNADRMTQRLDGYISDFMLHLESCHQALDWRMQVDVLADSTNAYSRRLDVRPAAGVGYHTVRFGVKSDRSRYLELSCINPTANWAAEVDKKS